MNTPAASPLTRLSLGPIQYHWSKEKMLDFYREVAAAPVDVVYLGETVCSKRRSFRHHDWLDVAERLQAAGKEVVLSTLALLEADSELGYVRKLCNNGRYRVEANDMSAVQLLAGKSKFVGGASLNLYNPRSLGKLAGLGLFRWLVPLELSKDALAGFQEEMPPGVETEVLAWGRLPLAYSARCYTARALDVPKDACDYCCAEFPDGLMLATREDENFLNINGIQIQSARVYNLIDELTDPDSVIDIFRISPQSIGTVHVLYVFDRVRKGLATGYEASQELEQFADEGFCNGYWHNDAGMSSIKRVAQP